MGARDSTLGFALLGLLHQAQRSGYDLRKAFTATPLAHFRDSPGAIYPALRRLRRQGFIEPLTEERPSGRRRQAFQLTPAGRRAFLAWLQAAPTRDEVVRDMDALVMRLGFMSQALPASAVLSYVDALRAEVEAYLVELERFLATAGGQMPLSARLAFESGLEGFRACAGWATRARRRLREEARKEGRRE